MTSLKEVITGHGIAGYFSAIGGIIIFLAGFTSVFLAIGMLVYSIFSKNWAVWKKWKYIGYLILLGIFLLIAGVIIAMFEGDNQNRILIKNIKEEIQQSIDTDDMIDFAKLTSFEWDTLYLIPPYSSIEDIKKQTGLSLNSSQTKIEDSDGISLLLFTKNGELVEYIEFTRIYGDFAYAAKLSHDKSKFKVWEENNWIKTEILNP